MAENKAIVILFSGEEPSEKVIDKLIGTLIKSGVSTGTGITVTTLGEDELAKKIVRVVREDNVEDTSPEYHACVYLNNLFGKGDWNPTQITTMYVSDLARHDYSDALKNAIQIIATTDYANVRNISLKNHRIVKQIYQSIPTNLFLYVSRFKKFKR